MEKKSIQELTGIIFRTLTLAMGVAVVVLNCLGALESDTTMTLLGLGLASAGIAMLGKK